MHYSQKLLRRLLTNTVINKPKNYHKIVSFLLQRFPVLSSHCSFTLMNEILIFRGILKILGLTQLFYSVLRLWQAPLDVLLKIRRTNTFIHHFLHIILASSAIYHLFIVNPLVSSGPLQTRRKHTSQQNFW